MSRLADIRSEMDHIRGRIRSLGKSGMLIKDPIERRAYRQMMRPEYEQLQVRFKQLRSQLAGRNKRVDQHARLSDAVPSVAEQGVVKSLASSLYKIVTKQRDCLTTPPSLFKDVKVEDDDSDNEPVWHVPNRAKTPEPRTLTVEEGDKPTIQHVAKPDVMPTNRFVQKPKAMKAQVVSSDESQDDVPVWVVPGAKQRNSCLSVEEDQSKRAILPKPKTVTPIAPPTTKPVIKTPSISRQPVTTHVPIQQPVPVRKRVVTFKNLSPDDQSETETDGEPTVRNAALLAGLKKLK